MNRPPAHPPLDQAYCFAQAQIDAGMPAARIINDMVKTYGAHHSYTAATNTLTCAGVRADCTWSADVYLLAAWLRAARAKIAELRGPVSPFVNPGAC